MGTESFGRYQLLDKLGRGGMGQVYRAYDTDTDRVVALKVLNPHLAEDREFQSRLRREARVAASLNDPHVVPIHGFGEIDGQLYVDMRLIEGRDLAKFIADEGGRLSPARAVNVIEQIASALDCAHRAGLVHRDIKPSNILVTDSDFAYLIDFGIARAAGDTSVTGTGLTVGTFGYMAPERFNGTTEPSSDIYSLACVLHECLTGHRPYPGDTLEQQFAGHLTSPPPRPSSVWADIPEAFDAVLARGMAKDPEDRYPTTTEFAGAARAALSGAPGDPAPRRAAKRRLPRRGRRAATSAPVTRHRPLEPGQPASQRGHAQRNRKRRFAIAGASVAALIAAIAVAATLLIEEHQERLPAAAGTAVVPPLPPFKPSASLGADCEYPPTRDKAARPVNPPRSGAVPTSPAVVGATISTNQGNFGIQLENAESPCTVNSFVSLAQQGFFDGSTCHRLTTNPTLGMLQCGDPTGAGRGGPGYEFANEYPSDEYPPHDVAGALPVIYPRGTLAMASTGQPDTSGSQFFMVYKDSQLNPEYTVFGVIQQDGLAILDRVAAAGVAGGGDRGKPTIPVTIASVRVG